MQRKTRLVLQILLSLLVAAGTVELGAAVVLRSLRPAGDPTPARPVIRIPGPLLAGAAVQAIDIPPRHSLAGDGAFRGSAEGSAGGLEARAVVIGKLAIVSLDILEVPASLEAVVARKLGSDLSVWLCATHTHSGPGGYDPARLAQWAGARRFEPGVFAALADAATAAVSAAAWNARPARARWGRADNPELKRGRSPGSTPDSTLWALAIDGEEGDRIVTLVAFGAHPTLVPRSAAQLSPDWPGAAASDLERTGGVGIVLQAIGGDSSAAAGEPSARRRDDYGEKVSAAAARALASASLVSPTAETIGEAKALLTWDPSVLTHVRLPGTKAKVATTVRVAAVGDQWLVCLPGEVTGAAWMDLVQADPRLRRALPITLCGDELSYVESPRLIRDGLGERLVLYPDAVTGLGKGLRNLLEALSE